MKSKHIVAMLMLFIVTSVSAQNNKLLVVHTNDTHSCIMPVKNTTLERDVAGKGGYIRRISYINEERKENPDMLLFDSGDWCQGSPYYTMFKGEVEIGLMNMMKYDAAVIGNHEFDFGLEAMADMFRLAKFPIVCCNYDFTGTPVEGLTKDYIVLQRGDVKIGVFGISPKLDGLVSDTNCEGVKYLDPVECAQKAADDLRNKEKCDIVICLTHMGWGDNDVQDPSIMSKTRGIDIFLGGHSHTYFDELEYVKNLDGEDIPNDQNGKHGAFIGRLEIQLEK